MFYIFCFKKDLGSFFSVALLTKQTSLYVSFDVSIKKNISICLIKFTMADTSSQLELFSCSTSIQCSPSTDPPWCDAFRIQVHLIETQKVDSTSDLKMTTSNVRHTNSQLAESSHGFCLFLQLKFSLLASQGSCSQIALIRNKLVSDPLLSAMSITSRALSSLCFVLTKFISS